MDIRHRLAALWLIFIVLACAGCGAGRIPVNPIVVSLPDWLVPSKLFAVDSCRGRQPELIAAGNGGYVVASLDGKILSEARLNHNRYAPSFTADYDGDKKADLFYGTDNAPTAEILVMDGCGSVKHRMAFSKSGENFAVLVPRLISDGYLFATAEQGWIKSPKGILKLKLPMLTREWFFYTPSAPVSLSVQYDGSGSPVFTVSHRTHGTGENSFFGLKRIYIDGLDNNIHLFRLNPAGEIVSQTKLRMGDTGLMGEARFIPLGFTVDAPLLLLQVIDEEYDIQEYREEYTGDIPVSRLYIVESRTGTISAASEPIQGIVEDVRVAREHGTDIIYVLGKTGTDTWFLRTYTTGLYQLCGLEVGAEYMSLGQVIRQFTNGTETVKITAVLDRKIIAVDKNLNYSTVFENEEIPWSIAVFKYHDRLFAACAGKRLYIIPLAP